MVRFFKYILSLVYTDDVDIIGCTKPNVTTIFSAIEQVSTKMIILTHITADNYAFVTVKEIIILAPPFLVVKDVSLEIKRKIALANRCFASSRLRGVTSC